MKAMIDKELAVLHEELLIMGGLCEKAIKNATKALLEYDLSAINTTVYTEIEIAKKERDIEELCLQLLLKQHPVARDLRKISSTLKMLTDMDRIGRQARDIAEILLQTDLSRHIRNTHIKEIATASMKMVTDSIDAYGDNDLQACEAVIEEDNLVDELFNEMKKDIIEMVLADKTQIENGMYLLMIAKYYEKIADHATNIAHWVEFSNTGKYKGEDIS